MMRVWLLVVVGLSIALTSVIGQEAPVEIQEAVDAEEGVAQAIVVVADEEDAVDGVVLEEDEAVVEVNAGGGIIGGFFQMIGGGLGMAKQPGPSKEALKKDIDKIESEAELKKLLIEFKRHPRVQGMGAQFELQLNTMHYNELRLIHYTCNLKRSEFKLIQERSKLSQLKAQLKAYRNLISPGSKPTDPQAFLEEELAGTVDDVLNSERAAAYRTEVKARREFRREAVTNAMASLLDRKLMFQAEQRDDANALLLTNWSDKWLGCTQFLSSNGNPLQYFPEIPKKAIRGILSEGQKDLFNSMVWQPQNVQFNLMQGNMFGFGREGGVVRLEKELDFAPEDEGAE